jgi:heme oxygenase (biliverdin-IX-beta and delta-forming)
MDILSQLKSATAEQHDRLESDLDVSRPSMDLAQYQKLLERFYGFYTAWEPAVAPELDRIPELDFEKRRKLPLLARDLREVTNGDIRLDSLPVCTDLPAINGLARKLGSMYVTEGSTLGGQLLSRHFGQLFDLDAKSGCAFFSSYQDGLGSMWTAFRNLLVKQATSENTAEIIGGAVDTFRCMHRWLCMERTTIA